MVKINQTKNDLSIIKGGEKNLNHNKKFLFLLTLSLLLATVSLTTLDDSSAASTIYVNGTSGDDNYDGETPATAKKTIKNATGTVDPNGEVLIADDIYTGADNRDIIIDRNMTITGQSKEGTIIDAQNLGWIFMVSAGINVTISNLSLVNGNALGNYGAAIRNEGDVTVTECDFTGNTASYSGAIGNIGTCRVTDCTFSGNSATFNGGAISNDGNLIVTGSTFTGNTAGNNGGAIASDGTLTVTECTFTGNSAVNGGAISNLVIGPNIGNAEIHFSRLVDNTAVNGNAIYNEECGIVDAENNWWGSNSNPKNVPNKICGDVDNVDVDPWLVLKIKADPTCICNGQTSNVIAYLTDNSDNQDTSALGHIPDGTPVHFTLVPPILGTINPTDVGTTDGVANAIFTANTVGTQIITATVDHQTVGDSYCDPAEVLINPSAHVVLTKTADNLTPDYGNLVTFTITAHNNGPNDAQGVVITDVLPAGLTYVSSSMSQGTYVDGIWNVGTLEFCGDDAWLEIIANVTGTGSICNWVNVTGQETCDIEPFDETSLCIDVPVANVTMTKTGNGPVNVNETMIFTITITNNGPNDAQGVVVTDVAPPGFTDWTVPSGTTYDGTTWNIGTLLNGETKTLLIKGTATQSMTGTNITNTATEVQTTYNPVPVTEKSATIRVKKCSIYVNVSPTIINTRIGNTVTITYKVGNLGPDDADGVVMTFVIPEGLEYVSSSSPDWTQATYDPETRTVTWILGNVPVGDPTLNLNVKVLRAGTFVISPTIVSKTCTGQPVVVATTTVNAQAQPHKKTVPMQKTGTPITGIALAILLVVGGLAGTRKKQ